MPDLIVTDLQMPAGGGAGLFDNVRQHPKTSMIPVVIVTAQDSEEVRQAALASGVAGYLPKPVDHDLLVRTLKSALGEG